ncbi:hypothetical protein ACQ4PT_068703 [Festuca glaucescens]
MDVVAAASPNIYLQDLVSFGRGILRQGIVIQDATVENSSLPVDTFEILLIDNSVVYKNARDITVLDRSHLYPGQAEEGLLQGAQTGATPTNQEACGGGVSHDRRQHHHTSVDVLWQDGTLQHGIPSATLIPFGMVNEQEFFPAQHVVENGLSFDAAADTNGEHNGATRRVGIVRSLDYKDQTVCVSWFKVGMCPDEAREVECIDTMSAYDLKLNYSPYYGDIVVRLVQSESTNSDVDLSWVGRVVDLPDGHVQVKWADGSMSKVSPHEIVVVNEEHYMELWTEMGDWVEDDGIDEEPANTNNDLQNPADYSDVENDDPAETTTNLLGLAVRSLLPLTGDMVAQGKGSPTNRQPPPSSLVPSSEIHAATEHIAAAVTMNIVDVECHDFATCSCDESLSFPRFDVLEITPEDHHYIDDADQGGSRGKNWAKAVQNEWQILENNLPVYYHSYGLRLNPNLYESGTVCLSLLNTFDGEGTELWSSVTSSLLQVVVSIQGLVLNGQPYYNEAGYETLVGKPEGRRNALPYSENAYLLSLRTMLHVLRRPPQGFEEFVKAHFRRQGRFVLTTCDAFLRGCVVGNAHATEASKKQPCSAGLKLALANMLPILVAAFIEIGAQRREEFKKLYALSHCSPDVCHGSGQVA